MSNLRTTSIFLVLVAVSDRGNTWFTSRNIADKCGLSVETVREVFRKYPNLLEKERVGRENRLRVKSVHERAMQTLIFNLTKKIFEEIKKAETKTTKKSRHPTIRG